MNLKQENKVTFIKRSFQHLFMHYGRTTEYAEVTGTEVSDKIYKLLMGENPALICRMGSTELQCLVAYLRESQMLKDSKLYKYLHWNDVIDNMCTLSGFFPADKALIEKFSQLMLDDLKIIDLLGSWRKEEYYVKAHLNGLTRIRLRDIEPFYHDEPWTKALENKKVLVIHPFESSIKQQYSIREKLFKNPMILPKFELKTIRAVQSIAGNTTGFNTWFDALDHMKKQIDETDFDIALIGCGAYGFPLAAHVKRIGKKAVHVGGALQLFFGIMGKRWKENPKINEMLNEHWIYPLDEDIPDNKDKVEEGCYWK